MTDSRHSPAKRPSATVTNSAKRASWRGAALLAVTGAVGLALAVHGWSTRNVTLPGHIAGQSSPVPGGAAASAPATPKTGPPAGPQIGPTASPSATPSPTAGVGPLLAAQSYARYSFQVWPGPLSPAAKAAMTGLTITATHAAGGIRVVAGVVGQPPAHAHLYVGGARVYVVEAALGDDSNNADYNLGDDGVIVTNAAGRILR